MDKKLFYYDVNPEEWGDISDFEESGALSAEEAAWFKGKISYKEIVDFAGAGGGFAAIIYRVAPNVTVPRHYHDVDQFDYILEGERYEGKNVLKPGMGSVVPAGAKYSWKSGPGGVTFLEIHDRSPFKTIFNEPVEEWDKYL